MRRMKLWNPYRARLVLKGTIYRPPWAYRALYQAKCAQEVLRDYRADLTDNQIADLQAIINKVSGADAFNIR